MFFVRRLGLACAALWLTSWSAVAELTFAGGRSENGAMVIDAGDGVTRGTNLLHSFDTFSIRAGESATFTGPDAIDHIIARVTGVLPTEIGGPLRSTIVDADFFLLNPNGVMVSEGASIEIDGELTLATAGSIRFADDSLLLVSDSGASGFSAAAPAAFGFDPDAGDISFIRASLDALAGSAPRGLHLMGADITLDSAAVMLDGGDLSLTAVAGGSEVSQRPAGDLSAADGAISIIGSSARPARLETSGAPAGRLTVRGGSLVMQGDAFLFADDSRGDLAVDALGGVDVRLSGNADLRGGARITTDALGDAPGGAIDIVVAGLTLDGDFTQIGSGTRSAAGAGGEISIAAATLALTGGAQISSVTLADGPSGAISIEAGDLLVQSGSAITAETRGNGDAGPIRIAAGTLLLEGQDSAISSATLRNAGDAGEIVINAASVRIADSARLSAESIFPFTGAPGAITLNVGELIVEGLATVSTRNDSLFDDGGAISVTADRVELSGSDPADPEAFFSGITSSASGDGAGGAIRVTAPQIQLDAGAAITAVTFSFGDAGSIELTGDVTVDAARLDARTLGEGAGGAIRVDGGLTVTGGGRVETSAPEDFPGVGSAGLITIEGAATRVAGGAISSSTSGRGNAGNIVLDVETLTVEAGGSIDTSTLAGAAPAGTAGFVQVRADALTVTGSGSKIASTTAGPARGGSININAGRVGVTAGAAVTVTAAMTGDAGDITVAAEDLEVLGGAGITTNAALSGGGNVALDIARRVTLREATVTASSGGPEAGADGGNVTFGRVGVAHPRLLILDRSSVVAQAVRGNGGIVNLFSGDLVADIHSIVSATSELGNDGEVTITSPDNGIAGAIADLDAELGEQTLILEAPCAARAFAGRSSLVIEKADKPAAPDDYGAPANPACAPR